MVQALAGVALFEFAQIQPGAEVRAFSVEHRSAHRGGQLFKQVAQPQYQCVGQGVALGTAGETHDGNLLLVAADVEMDVLVGHGCFSFWSELWL